VSEPERPQVSWKAIDEGAKLAASDGSEVGKITKIVGDPEADILTGFAFKRHALSDEQMVEADHVRGIWEDRVEVDLPPDAIERLPRYEDEPVIRVRPDDGGFFHRLFRRR